MKRSGLELCRQTLSLGLIFDLNQIAGPHTCMHASNSYFDVISQAG